jgi:hypothetical protein
LREMSAKDVGPSKKKKKKITMFLFSVTILEYNELILSLNP